MTRASASGAGGPRKVAAGIRRLGLAAQAWADVKYNQMVVYDVLDEDVDRIFHALADSTRRDIVMRVVQSEQSVSALAAGYAMSFAAVQKHVAVLERAALVRKERRGREQIVHGNVDAVRRATLLLQHVEELWRYRAQGISEILSEDQHKEENQHEEGEKS